MAAQKTSFRTEILFDSLKVPLNTLKVINNKVYCLSVCFIIIFVVKEISIIVSKKFCMTPATDCSAIFK
jgi:hypothetical protein